MSFTFYYAPMSTASIISLVLEELDVPHERVRLDIQKGDTKDPKFLEVNPNGKVPVIAHEGVVIFESSAITMYLGEVFGVDKGLYPALGPQRGEAMKWITWTNVTFSEAIGRWLRNTMDSVPEELRNAKAGQAARADIDRCLGILDGALADRKYLTGDDYTLADAHLVSCTHWLSFNGIGLQTYDNAQAWSNRCVERPAFKRFQASPDG